MSTNEAMDSKAVVEAGKDRQDDDHGNKTFEVTVRTPAGAGHKFEVKRNERVDKVIRKTVEYFVAAGQLAAGNYGLAVERDGRMSSLNDAGRLDDFDVTERDVLFLTIKDPQVDG
jgi:hypothetical protein